MINLFMIIFSLNIIIKNDIPKKLVDYFTDNLNIFTQTRPDFTCRFF